MSLILTALRLYMIQLERRRTEIESQHVSRGVIRMVSDDLRSAIQYKAADYSALEDLIASQSLAGLGGAAGLTGDTDSENIDADQLEQEILDAVAAGGSNTGNTGAANTGDNAATAPEEDADTESEDVEEEEKGRPTFIGTSTFIRLDISRLPRLDEYNPLIVDNDAASTLPSDIKSITYFFSEQPPQQQFSFGGEVGKNGGLYRRQIDRAVESFRSGDQDIEVILQPDEYCELVSPEISRLEFRYWDGEDWLSQWDSVEMMGFPSAVEIVVLIDSERVATDLEKSDFDKLEVELIRTVVHLPVAEIIPEEEEETDGGSR